MTQTNKETNKHNPKIALLFFVYFLLCLFRRNCLCLLGLFLCGVVRKKVTVGFVFVIVGEWALERGGQRYSQ